MEELLNKVYDEEIKDYLNEAFKCYMGGSYRACVIISVIAGIYDLHKKVKALAASNSDFRKLDDEIDKRKQNLQVYEKHLIDQCATNEIDMLNNNEQKELQRCLDTRNDCAHPSNFICSAEKARDIYSSIIDILASKPVLLGCRHMNSVIDEMEEKSFFPINDTLKMKSIINDRLSRFQKKAIAPLFKQIVTTIKNTSSSTQKNNAIRFLALAAEYVIDEYEIYISEFIDKDQFEGNLLSLLELNIDIFKYVSDLKIEKIIFKLDTALKSSESNNINTWINIILSDRLQEDKYIENISQLITSFSRKDLYTSGYNLNEDVRYTIVRKILENQRGSEKFRELIRERCCSKNFSLDHFKDPGIKQILKLLNDKRLYSLWLDEIIYNIGCDFNKGNKAISVLESMDKEYWIDVVPNESKISLVKSILNEGTKSGYYSHSCGEIVYKLHSDYPGLTKLFLDNIFSNEENDDVKKYITDRYSWVVSKYIVAYEEMTETIIEKLKNLENDNVDVKSITDKLIEDIEQITDTQKKNLLLSKLRIS
jgi:hypothetical protein